MSTVRQIEANRRNSLLSSGPRTAEGKSVSRGNSLKDGFSGGGDLIPADMADDVADRVACFHTGLLAADGYDEWLILQAATESVRLDRLRCRESALRGKTTQRATLCWDDDRGMQAAELATKLARDPEATSRRLRQTPQGCTLLAGRWEALRRILETHGEWDEAQRSLALDLLGVPAVLRGAGTTELDGAPGADAAACAAAVAGRELARLALPERVDLLAVLDELEREQAQRGLDVGDGREARLLARYEAAAARRLAWALDELKQRQARRERGEQAERRGAEEVQRRTDEHGRLAVREREAAAGMARLFEQVGPFEPAPSSFVPISAAPAPAASPSASDSAALTATATLTGSVTGRNGAGAAAPLTAPAVRVDGSQAPRKPMSAKQRSAWYKKEQKRKHKAAAR